MEKKIMDDTSPKEVAGMLRARGIRQAKLAIKLNRSRTAVNLALNGSGQCKPLYKRIIAYIEKYDAKKAKDLLKKSIVEVDDPE